MTRTPNAFLSRDHCPACGSSDFEIVADSPYLEPPVRDYLISFYSLQGESELVGFEGVRYTLQDCRECGLVYQRYAPADWLSQRLYEEWISPDKAREVYDSTHGVQYSMWLAADLCRVIGFLNLRPGAIKCLDFGMGWGRWCLFAKAFGLDVYGLEISSARLASAAANGIRTLTWSDIGQHRFELIRAEQVLEHLPDPLSTLEQLTASLAPNGILEIGVPDGKDIRTRIKIWNWQALKGSPESLNAVAPLEHLNCFGPASLDRLAREAGLERVDIASQETGLRHRWSPRTLAAQLVSCLRRTRPLTDSWAHCYFRRRR